jgi:hypothetical protein
MKKEKIQHTMLRYPIHFWEHTRLSCCLSFRRAKVYPSGNYYIKIVGKCTGCDSYFEGIVYENPSAISR